LENGALHFLDRRVVAVWPRSDRCREEGGGRWRGRGGGWVVGRVEEGAYCANRDPEPSIFNGIFVVSLVKFKSYLVRKPEELAGFSPQAAG